MSDFKKYLNVYEFETTLPGSGEVIKYKPITTGQLKKLLIYEDDDDPSIIEEALDDLITSSVISEGFDVTDLYLQDRFFLLVEIRKVSKGTHYNFNITCPECNSQSLQTIDLESLPLKLITEEVNPFVKLDDNITIGLDYIKRMDQKVAAAIVNESEEQMGDMQRLAEMSLIATAIAIKIIVTPEGEDTEAIIEDRLFLIESLPQAQFTKITDWFENSNFGLDFEFKLKCPHIIPPIRKGGPGKLCSYEEEMDIPIDDFFF
jgi:hypothetical protein